MVLGEGIVWVADRAGSRARAFDLATLAPSGEVTGLGERLALSPDGRILVGASGTDLILASTDRREVYRRFRDPGLFLETNPDLSDLQVAPNGQWVASCYGSDARRVGLWDPTSAHLTLAIPWSSDGRGSCSVSPDGRRIAVTGYKKTLLYEVRDSDVRRSLAHVTGASRTSPGLRRRRWPAWTFERATARFPSGTAPQATTSLRRRYSTGPDPTGGCGWPSILLVVWSFRHPA